MASNLNVGDKVNTYAGSVAIILAIHGDKAQIEVISMNPGPNVGDRIFSGVPLRTLTKIS